MLRRLLVRCYDEMRSVCERHGGVVREFAGDAMLAVFGTLVAHEDDALRACAQPSRCVTRLDELNDELAASFGVRSLRARA